MIEKYRAYVEAHKFTGPTIKLLRLEDGAWAVLDHEYNLLCVITPEEFSTVIPHVFHPPQRERPRPHIHEQPAQSFNIDMELDI